MFFLPLGLACGADLSWTDVFASNIVPVTIGNAIGGAIFAGGFQLFALGGTAPHKTGAKEKDL